jgi:hypothetical protein
MCLSLEKDGDFCPPEHKEALKVFGQLGEFEREYYVREVLSEWDGDPFMKRRLKKYLNTSDEEVFINGVNLDDIIQAMTTLQEAGLDTSSTTIVLTEALQRHEQDRLENK